MSEDDDEIAEERELLAREVATMAGRAVEIAADHGVTLDFSEASIGVLDGYLADLATWQMTESQKESASHLLAAYLLEVGRRAHGGFFQWWEARDAPVLVVGDPEFHIGLLTLDKVRGRIGGDEGDAIPFFYSGFATRVASAQPGDAATYV